jgi:hypothetical protein
VQAIRVVTVGAPPSSPPPRSPGVDPQPLSLTRRERCFRRARCVEGRAAILGPSSLLGDWMLLSASGQRPFGPAVAWVCGSCSRRRSTAAQLFLAGAFRPAVRPVEVIAAAVLPAVRVAAGPLAALAAVLLLGAPLRAVVRPTVNVPAGGAVGAGLVARRVVVFVGGVDLAAAVVVGADFAAEVAGSGVAVVVWRAPDRAASVAAAAPAAELHAARPQRTP